MSADSQIIVDTWDLFKDLINQNKRQEHCEQLLRLFDEYGLLPDDHSELKGHDQYIDTALKDMFGDEDDEIDDDEY